MLFEFESIFKTGPNGQKFFTLKTLLIIWAVFVAMFANAQQVQILDTTQTYSTSEINFLTNVPSGNCQRIAVLVDDTSGVVFSDTLNHGGSFIGVSTAAGLSQSTPYRWYVHAIDLTDSTIAAVDSADIVTDSVGINGSVSAISGSFTSQLHVEVNTYGLVGSATLYYGNTNSFPHGGNTLSFTGIDIDTVVTISTDPDTTYFWTLVSDITTPIFLTDITSGQFTTDPFVGSHVTTLAPANGVTTNSASVNANVTVGNTVDSVQVRVIYSDTVGGPPSQTPWVTAMSGINTVDLTGLMDSTTYEYQFFLREFPSGNILLGGIEYFTTDTIPVPVGTPKPTLNLSELSSNGNSFAAGIGVKTTANATLQWEMRPIDITYVSIVSNSLGINVSDTIVESFIDLPNGKPTGAQYEFWVRVTDSIGQTTTDSIVVTLAGASDATLDADQISLLLLTNQISFDLNYENGGQGPLDLTVDVLDEFGAVIGSLAIYFEDTTENRVFGTLTIVVPNTLPIGAAFLRVAGIPKYGYFSVLNNNATAFYSDLVPVAPIATSIPTITQQGEVWKPTGHCFDLSGSKVECDEVRLRFVEYENNIGAKLCRQEFRIE